MAELSPTSGKDKRLRKIFFEVPKLRSIVGFAFPSVQGLNACRDFAGLLITNLLITKPQSVHF